MNAIKRFFLTQKPPELGSFNTIPNELILHIASYLPAWQDRLSFSHVCKTFRHCLPIDQRYIRFCQMLSKDARVKEIVLPPKRRFFHSQETHEIFVPEFGIDKKDIHYFTIFDDDLKSRQTVFKSYTFKQYIEQLVQQGILNTYINQLTTTHEGKTLLRSHVVFSTKDSIFYLDRELSEAHILARGCFLYNSRIRYRYDRLNQKLYIFNKPTDATVLTIYKEVRHGFKLLQKISFTEDLNIGWFKVDQKLNKIFIHCNITQNSLKLLELKQDVYKFRDLIKYHIFDTLKCFYDDKNHWLIAIEKNYLRVINGSSEDILYSTTMTHLAKGEHLVNFYDQTTCKLFTAVKKRDEHSKPWKEVNLEIWDIASGKRIRSFSLWKGDHAPQRIDYDPEINIVMIQSKKKITFWDPETGKRVTDKEFPYDQVVWDKEQMKLIYLECGKTHVLGFRQDAH